MAIIPWDDEPMTQITYSVRDDTMQSNDWIDSDTPAAAIDSHLAGYRTVDGNDEPAAEGTKFTTLTAWIGGELAASCEVFADGVGGWVTGVRVILAGLLIAAAAHLSPAAADSPRLAISKPGAHQDRIVGNYLYEMYVLRRKARRAYAIQERRRISSRRRPAVYYLPRPYHHAPRPPRYPVRTRYLQVTR